MEHFFTKGILPAVTVDDADSAKRLAEAYLNAGLDIMEISFRTDATLSSIEAIAGEFPDMKIGSGTILSPRQISLARDAGAQFGLSPGLNEQVVQAAAQKNFPFVPGVITPSEIEKALDLGFRVLKLFPVSNAGGADFIRALEGPYAQTGVRFIPMGGVHAGNMHHYLECESVLAVGGSWLAPRRKIGEGAFEDISAVVRESLDLVRPSGTE